MNTLIDNNKKYSDTRVRDPNKSSMASNHLSKYGRFGDNMMYRTSEGELWHVNKEEKSLMDSLGKAGEHLVAVKGAGTINPDTGLKEQWILPALGIGIGLISGYASNRAQRRGFQGQAATLYESLRELKKAEDLLPKTREAKETALQLDRDVSMKELSLDTSKTLDRAMRATDRALSRTGFATQGEITKSGQQTLSDIYEKSIQSAESLKSKFDIGMGELEGWFASQQAKLDAEKRKVRAMLDTTRQRANQKFLGLF